MQTLGLSNETEKTTAGRWTLQPASDNTIEVEPEKGFWKRQFQQTSTSGQKKFDWMFGVLMPVICFFFDPIVFKENGIGNLHQYRFGVYIFTYFSILAMMAWLIWRDRLGSLNAVLSGLFAVGGLVALAIGVVIFPISLLGLLFLIGALGFTPLFTSVVYIRNAVRAARAAQAVLDKRTLVYTISLAGLLSLVTAYVINAEVVSRITVLGRLSSWY